MIHMVNKIHSFTIDEIAEYPQVEPSTIYQWTHTGFIPHVKLGNRVRFRLSQVDRWVEKRAVEGRTKSKLSILSKL